MSKKLSKAAFNKQAKSFIADFTKLLEAYDITDTEHTSGTFCFNFGETYRVGIHYASTYDWTKDDAKGEMNVCYEITEYRETSPRKKHEWEKV